MTLRNALLIQIHKILIQIKAEVYEKKTVG